MFYIVIKESTNTKKTNITNSKQLLNKTKSTIAIIYIILSTNLLKQF